MSALPAIPEFQIYSLRDGSVQRVSSRANGLNAQSSFTLPATLLTPAYSVNFQSAQSVAELLQNTAGYGLSGNPANPGEIQQTTPNLNSLFDQALALGNFSQTQGTVFQAATTPTSLPGPLPTSLAEQMQYYTVTDAQFDTLRQQNSFRIPNIGIGVEVQTDGAGNITGSRVVNEQARYQPRTATTAEQFALFNSPQLTRDATYTVRPVGISDKALQAITESNAQQALQSRLNPPAQPPSSNLLEGLQPSGLLEKALNPEKITSALGNETLNPLQKLVNSALEKLQQFPAGQETALRNAQALQNELNPSLRDFKNQTIPLSSTESPLPPETFKNVAATQAGFNLNLGQNYQQQLAALAALRYQEFNQTVQKQTQGPINNPTALTRAVDGLNPAAAYTPLPQEANPFNMNPAPVPDQAEQNLESFDTQVDVSTQNGGGQGLYLNMGLNLGMDMDMGGQRQMNQGSAKVFDNAQPAFPPGAYGQPRKPLAFWS